MVALARDDMDEAASVLNLSFYPWQEEQRELLLSLNASGRMHHAFLLYGVAHTGKFDFASAMSASLLCEQSSPGEPACQQCHACHLCRNMSHPDFHVLRPEAAGKQIRVDDIRALVQFMSKSAGRQGKRVVIIDQCQQMNTAAANALLKFLEEPGEGVHLFLVCQQMDALLPTIRSRCQKLAFPTVGAALAREWLRMQLGDDEQVDPAVFEYANGAPLLARKLMGEAIFLERDAIIKALKQCLVDQQSLSEALALLVDLDLIDLLELWYAYCADVLKLLAGADVSRLRFQSHDSELRDLVGYFKARQLDNALLDFSEGLFRLRQNLLRGSMEQRPLALQALLIGWQQLGA